MVSSLKLDQEDKTDVMVVMLLLNEPVRLFRGHTSANELVANWLVLLWLGF